jgi:ABC-type transport system involved in cytochrome c biogenesis ATPase subunit
MILQFSVSNFRCFRARQTLNLAASASDKSLPDNVIVHKLPGVEGGRWLKGVALYGANASGKTTMLAALRALAAMVQTSAKMTDPKDPIPQIEPFALCPGQSEIPTAFSVTFVMDGVRYEYRVAATRERIWHESLRAFPKAKEQLWFCRDWESQDQRYVWTPERPVGFTRDLQLEKYTLSNMLFLSKAIANNRADVEPVFRWFKEHLRFLDLSDPHGLTDGFTLQHVIDQTAQQGRIVELLRHADLGVTNVRAVENSFLSGVAKEVFTDKVLRTFPQETQEAIRSQKWMRPELVHRGNAGAEVPLPWTSESAGTMRLFALAGPWLDIMKNGYTVCIDELESSMHPLMVRELLRLLFCGKENRNGAQILFTTHNSLLLDATLLRRDQAWFTDKDDQGEAHLYPLTDYQPRKGESLVRGYLSGRYGAVPFLRERLLGTFSPSIPVVKKTKKKIDKSHA